MGKLKSVFWVILKIFMFDWIVLCAGVKHPNIICDACKKQGIQGMRWKCAKCYDFDLCHQCYMGDKHDHTHAFLRFETPNMCTGYVQTELHECAYTGSLGHAVRLKDIHTL